MEELLERIKYFLELNKKKIILISFIILLSIISITGIYYFNSLNKETKEVINELEVVDEVIQKKEPVKEEVFSEEIKMVYVDIKGEVKKPGVYQVTENSIINDVIKKAGGLTKNASTLVNNLSRKVHSEMVIVIYSKKEIEEFSKTKEKEEVIIENSSVIKDTLINDSVIDNSDIDTNTNIVDKEEVKVEEEKEEIENTETTNFDKVSINTASIDELMTVSGIGKSKANSIIEYRNSNGSFKSIEDIKNVSGIGESLYEKIKDFITL